MSNPTKLSTRVDQAAKMMKLTPELVWKRLHALGIDDDEESLTLLESDFTQEADAREEFVDRQENPVPIVRFKAGWQILKGKADNAAPTPITEVGLSSILEAMKSPAQMKDEELLGKYNPDASTEIIDELKRRSKDRAFVVFSNDSTIDAKASLELLRIARRQETPATYKLGDKIVRVYRLGEFPMSYVEECPIYSDIILAGDYCERCMESWTGVTYDDRVLVRVAKDMGAIDVSSLAKINELITKLKSEGANFLMKIPAVALRYQDLKDDNKLPTLRRKLSASRNGKADPFYQKF